LLPAERTRALYTMARLDSPSRPTLSHALRVASNHIILVIALVAVLCFFPLAVSAQYNTDGCGHNADGPNTYDTVIGIGKVVNMRD
jgi:hypothetical protein